MIPAKGYAAQTPTSTLAPFEFQRRPIGPRDVLMEVQYCGICHSDIHQARDEWGGSIFPMVPGHEIVGAVREVGSGVSRFKAGDIVGVGCMVNSCRTCASCRDGLEQYCEGKRVLTYNDTEMDGKTPTYGGYSNLLVVDQDFTLRVPANLDLKGVAPLLCAGITTYSPLRHWGLSKGQRLGVIGLGGLGHMAVKFGVSFGAEVAVLSTSPKKQADARRLGAHHFCPTSDDSALQKLDGSLDLIIDTVSAPHDLSRMVNLLKRDGTLVMVGASPDALALQTFSIIGKRRAVAGSLIGGIKETQEMLDYCGAHSITSDIELIAMRDVNNAYERVLKSDVRYRFVIDLKTL